MLSEIIADVITFIRSGLTGIDTFVIGEYPDVDKYRNPATVYFLTPDFEFEELSNQSQAMSFILEIYVVYQKDTKDNMKSKSVAMVDSMYNLIIGNRSMGRKVDNSMISKIDVYDGVEGADNGCALMFRINCSKEI